MEKREYRFDMSFFNEQIKTAEKLLNDKNIDSAEKNKLIKMIKYFEVFTKNNNIEPCESKSKEIEINKNSCKQLEDKFNEDLEKLPIQCWKEMQLTYKNANNIKFPQKNHNNLLLSVESVMELILSLYKNLNEEYQKTQTITKKKNIFNT